MENDRGKNDMGGGKAAFHAPPQHLFHIWSSYSSNYSLYPFLLLPLLLFLFFLLLILLFKYPAIVLFSIKAQSRLGFLWPVASPFILDEVLMYLFVRQPKENLDFFFLTGMDFRLLTVKASFQHELKEEEWKGHSEWMSPRCFDTVSFHRRITLQVQRCFPF